MTRDELNIQKLVKEAQDVQLSASTRRHFIKESAMGLGALAIGSLLGNCGNLFTSSQTNISYDPAHPLLPKYLITSPS
jgi:hypothetical protein